jgi:hypothetical protein
MKVSINTNTTGTMNSGDITETKGQAGIHFPVLIRKDELAKRLSVSPRTIDEWVTKRMIPFIAASPRLHLFNFDEVFAILQKHYRIEPVGRA